MFRISAMSSLGKVLKSTYVTVALRKLRVFHLNFPVLLNIEEKTQIMDHLKHSVAPDNKIYIRCKAFTEMSYPITPSKLEFTISENIIAGKNPIDIDQIIKGIFSTTTATGEDKTIPGQDILDYLDTATVVEVMENTHETSKYLSGKITAGEILENVENYPKCAIPKRTHLDRSKWRLRNNFRLGIN